MNVWIGCRKFEFVYYAIAMFTLSLNNCAAQSQSLSFVASPQTSDFLVDLESIDWIHGSENCESLVSNPDYQEWQLIQYQPQSYLFRQNKCSHYEGPFVYLFLGEEKGLLIDSGATIGGGLRLVELIRGITELPILLVHTHGHSDHRLGDEAFRSQEGITVIGVGSSMVQSYFGFTNWPNEHVAIDLGSREIEVLPIPGHSDDDLAFYDAQSKIVITGDTVYPGRLYVSDWLEYSRSIARLADWLSQKPVSFVMGTHIEMSSTPNLDYPIGATYQPDEHRLPLSLSDIHVLRDKLEALESPERVPLGSFIVWPN